jgi:arylsulfatase A-like enzyme
MGAMIETMDKGIGKILAKLDELKLAENTLVVFYSDNGGLKLLQDQRPFRGGKAMLFQGGTRVPMAVRFPGKQKPAAMIAQRYVQLISFQRLRLLPAKNNYPRILMERI